MLKECEVVKMDEDKLLKELAEHIASLGFDYDRMSNSGQATYDQICSIMNQLLGG
jgi:hypothetical protein